MAVNDTAIEGNNLKEEVFLKKEAYSTLNATMEQLKADRDKDLGAAKEAAKVDLMGDFWGRILKHTKSGS